ncbi:transposon Tf2-9 polyprotein [Ixodes scapularis]
MSKTPILAIFDPGKLCTLYCDASQEGIGAVLKQTDGDGIEHPVAYYFRKLLNHERNYSITELECLAIVDAVDKRHCYLHGNQFTVITDHAALKWLKTVKNPSGRLFRWSLKLSMYAYTIKHLKGTDNVEADALSRSPIVGLIDIEDIRQAQPDLPPDHLNCRKENGIFVMRRKGLRKVFVAHSLRQQAIKKVHEDYGHVGVKKRLGLLSPHYYWPDIIKEVSACVKHCDICQKCKNSK